ncbi:hypothetical protein Misp01_29900 [Microtetraspora sp. NBRC 13810]|uniref:hypothetical protein n=1 Tax=Microtetraspora sp. NBRC 13810 TaxID=3030990 RepID=UPI0024A5CBEC|nr:hypothetical protein [Microtetraspora sp. NBRC 13810]GLW07860.1 hypothetical protein Misp01_29900 [Microtetraspora sp. NBRC 13810]
MPRTGRLTHAESLTVALTALATFNGYVQQAETKVTAVVTVHLGAAALAATQSGGLAPLWAAGLPTAAAAVVLLLTFALGFLSAGYHLAIALRPDLRAPLGANRFGLVRTAENAAPSPSRVKTQMEEIRLLVEVLAEVALRKHRRVRSALPWMALTFASVILWTVLNAVAR